MESEIYILFSWIEDSIDYLCAFEDEGEAYEVALSLAEDMAYENWYADVHKYHPDHWPIAPFHIYNPADYFYDFFVVRSPLFKRKEN